MGRANDHPSPVEFKYRLRRYLLSKNASKVFSKNTNCEQTEEEEIITAEMIGKAFQYCPLTETQMATAKEKIMQEGIRLYKKPDQPKNDGIKF